MFMCPPFPQVAPMPQGVTILIIHYACVLWVQFAIMRHERPNEYCTYYYFTDTQSYIFFVSLLSRFRMYIPTFECQLSKTFSIQAICIVSWIFGMLNPKSFTNQVLPGLNAACLVLIPSSMIVTLVQGGGTECSIQSARTVITQRVMLIYICNVYKQLLSALVTMANTKTF